MPHWAPPSNSSQRGVLKILKIYMSNSISLLYCPYPLRAPHCPGSKAQAPLPQLVWPCASWLCSPLDQLSPQAPLPSPSPLYFSQSVCFLLLPQGLCICCSHCLKLFPRYLCGSLLHPLQLSALKSSERPSQSIQFNAMTSCPSLMPFPA